MKNKTQIGFAVKTDASRRWIGIQFFDWKAERLTRKQALALCRFIIGALNEHPCPVKESSTARKAA